MCRVFAAALAGLLLLALVFPQPALADDPTQYSITVSPLSGAYGDAIGVWIDVPEAGTYHVCWGAASMARSITEIHAFAAGNWSGQFAVPEGARGLHENVLHLIKVENQTLARADFEIYPHVTMTPKQGPFGTAVTIKGYGFSANEANIPIEFRGSQVATATADAQGSWEETHSVPKLAAGSYPFEVGPDSVTDGVWHMHFTVTPKITADKLSGVAGETVRVSGTGFAANEKGITITFGGEAIKDGISAGADGSFTDTEITVPRRASGTYKIGASGFTTWAREVPTIQFTIGTGISASPTSAYIGDEITVTASGFAAWETGIKVTFAGTAVDTGTITADRHGTWQASFLVPTSTFGDKSVSAFGDSTPAAAVGQATVRVLATMEVNPTEGSPGDSVTVSGNGFPGTQTLTVTFANRQVPETNVQSLANGTLSFVVTVPASPAGPLSVTASGGGAQASADFTVIPKTLDTPQPVLPEDGRRLRSGEVEFEWGRITAGSEVTIKYTLRITGPGGSRSVMVDGLTYTVPSEESLPPGDYEWQVKAVDQFENKSEWSEPMPFRVSPIPVLVWVALGLVVFTTLMVVAYREEKFRLTP